VIERLAARSTLDRAARGRTGFFFSKGNPTMLWPSSTSPAARISLIYITIGSLIVIWTGVWYLYLHNNPPVVTDAAHLAPVFYWVGGLGVTGAVLIVIGLAVGRIGTSARQADVAHVAPVATDTNGQPVAVQTTNPPVAVVTTPAAAVPAAAPTVARAQTPAEAVVNQRT
jgi:hypothetical protein